jgi:peptidoglycan/LPS O-acetylase OafA/YrhL
VLLLVWASTQSRLVYLSIATCAIAVIGINPLILFLIGHLCARALDTQLFEKYGTKIATQLFAALLVVIGAALCSDVSLRGVWLPHRLLDHGLLHTYYWFWWPREFGAILLFVGILLSPLIHTCLSWRLPRYLGRMSFPVYLLHWPIMMVVGASVYIWLHPFGARVAAAGALIVGLALTFALAELFERWCDQPAVALGRSFGRAQKTAVPAAL